MNACKCLASIYTVLTALCDLRTQLWRDCPYSPDPLRFLRWRGLFVRRAFNFPQFPTRFLMTIQENLMGISVLNGRISITPT
ncbi:hypothetical protein BDY19DRAFT_606375 [Irpex rosettiformis]|uniref:Uncharacterized protein n=1 Tax=Irpex rosettiformis TaxID=378272 RepID=A0ACB8TPA1_9APHY|nr:hypothetical protein BDY19DRAFT_606375 [Irpex rosettiformis]